MKKTLIASLTFLLLTPAARADELYEVPRPVSVRGMGGVHLPWVSDVDAVMWNPAVLAETTALSWEIGGLGFGANGKEVFDTYKAMKDKKDAGLCSDPECYEEFFGQPIHVEYLGKSSFSMPYWGFTVFTSGLAEGTLHNPAFPALDMTYVADYGFMTGVGFNLLPGLSGGVTFKRINRRGGSQEIDLSTMTTSSSTIMDQFDQRGVGYGVDFGLLYRLPSPGIIQNTVALHWQDVGSTAFLPEGGHEAPTRIKDNLSLGVGTMIDLPGLDLRTGVEYRHINLQGEQLGKKLHMGVELGLPLIDVRAGLNQGYPTLGAGLDFWLLRLDAAYYKEEVGVYPGQTPSERVQVGLNLELSFDANFKFSDSQGKKRKLKQRR